MRVGIIGLGYVGLIKRHNNRTLHVVDEFPSDIPYDTFIITVGTLLKDGEKTPDFAYIRYIQNSKFQGHCPIPSAHPGQNHAVGSHSGFRYVYGNCILYARKGLHGYGRRFRHRKA